MKMFSVFCQISSSSLKPKTTPKYSWVKEKKVISSKIALVFWFCSKNQILEQIKFHIVPRLLHLPGFLDDTYMLLVFDRVPVLFYR